VLQLLPTNFNNHAYDSDMLLLDYNSLKDDELFENIHSMNTMFTVPFLPDNIKQKYEEFAQNQRGFQYKPDIIVPTENKCCCKK
jgi:hypothetical protein